MVSERHFASFDLRHDAIVAVAVGVDVVGCSGGHCVQVESLSVVGRMCGGGACRTGVGEVGERALSCVCLGLVWAENLQCLHVTYNFQMEYSSRVSAVLVGVMNSTKPSPAGNSVFTLWPAASILSFRH